MLILLKLMGANKLMRCRSGTFAVRRLPNSADLLFVWNNHPQRTNLTSARNRT